MEIVKGTGGPTLFYPFNIFPLRVIKQIVCMFMSANTPKFATAHPDLVRLVLDRDASWLPDDIRIYAFYTKSDRSRTAGVTGVLRTLNNGSSLLTISEVTFPPFGFFMTLTSPPTDERLCDITEFAGLGYRDWR